MQKLRPRRLRKSSTILKLTQENWIQAQDLIYPVFVKEGNGNEAIKSMPGIMRHGIESLLHEIDEACNLGIEAIAMFPVIDSSLKTDDAKEAYNPRGLTQKAIQTVKKNFPELILITDVALDPYTSHGHDGLIADGRILNDETVEVLCKMALVQAEAGADIIAPSDMMDGRIGAIRDVLDINQYQDTKIMAYTAKYASSLYGPFRDALGSLGSGETTKHGNIPKDKSSYQMNFANSREALRELELDVKEGADIVMVKPAGWYADIIHQFKQRSHVPVAAYQVSGEYAMLHASHQAGYIDLSKAMQESLLCLKRAGADLILSYFAKDFVKATSSN